MTEPTKDLNASLSSLAMLSVQLKEGKDYLDYLHGFVIDALHRLQGQSIDAASVQKAIDQEFGLKIPAATFAIYLKRLAKQRLLAPLPGGVQFRIVALPATTIGPDRKAARNKINDVTDELAGFAHSRYSLLWDENTSAAALTEFVRQYSIDFLKFAESKSPLPEAKTDTPQADYVVAAFITFCAKERPSLFESIKLLVQSHMLANALMCPDLELTTRGFNGVTFFADTRFLLKTLDLESRYETDNVRELLDTIRKLKGVLCIFSETKEELRSVLKAIIKGMQQGTGRGPVYRELLKRGRGVADVILAEANLEKTLASMSITVFPSPKYDERNFPFQIDEEHLRDEIEGEVDYITDRAAEHDIRVVRHIFALRKGQRVSTIEDARFLFLTTNSALSRAAFYYEKKTSRGWFFSAVVTDYHLSHLAWLKSPMQAAAGLPRVEILANCYATMRPPEKFWNRYLAEIDRLSSEGKVNTRDHEVLRFALNAPDELMEVTRGDVEGINETNLHVVLEKLEKSIAAEKEEEIQQERAAHERTKAILQSQIELDAARAEYEHRETKEALAQAQATILSREERSRIKRERIATAIANCAFYLSGIGFALVGALPLFGYLSPLLGIPSAILGFFNLWTGFSGNVVKRAIRRWIERRLTPLLD